MTNLDGDENPNVRFSHVAYLVPSVDNAIAFLKSHGLKPQDPEVFQAEGTKEVYVGSYGNQSGLLLFVEAISDGPYKRALRKRGPSLHHIAVDVANIEQFMKQSQSIGWDVHPETERTLDYKTAWLYKRGVPTLIEAHEKKNLPVHPMQVTQIEIPLIEDHLALFTGIGLKNIVVPGSELKFTIGDQRFSFQQLRDLKT